MLWEQSHCPAAVIEVNSPAQSTRHSAVRDWAGMCWATNNELECQNRPPAAPAKKLGPPLVHYSSVDLAGSGVPPVYAGYMGAIAVPINVYPLFRPR